MFGLIQKSAVEILNSLESIVLKIGSPLVFSAFKAQEDWMESKAREGRRSNSTPTEQQRCYSANIPSLSQWHQRLRKSLP
jgi:hypothetical protein